MTVGVKTSDNAVDGWFSFLSWWKWEFQEVQDVTHAGDHRAGCHDDTGSAAGHELQTGKQTRLI